VGRVSYVVRQRVTHPRHKERFDTWFAGKSKELRAAIPELDGVRRYHFEKDELFFYTFYDFKEDARFDDGLRGSLRTIREAWREFGPDMREFTAVPYEEIWSRTAEGRTSEPATHPLTIERLSFGESAEQERRWNEWNENTMLPDQLGRLPLASITRYRALTGDPRYYLQVQEYLDEASMRDSIAKAEKPGTTFGVTSPSKFWAGWAGFMPHVDDLTRWIVLPVPSR
jgi:hypothetical protein